MGMDELSEEDKITVARACKVCSASCPSPSMLQSSSPVCPASMRR